MSWKAGKVFAKKNGTRGRYYYWRGNKKIRVFRSMNQGKPTQRPRTTRRRR